MPRGNSRGRGRGSFKVNSSRNDRESALDRLGSKIIYPKAINLKNAKGLYKYDARNKINQCVATLPAETRIRSSAKRFLKTYYEIFDQPGRPNLDSLYNADSFFSFSAPRSVLATMGRNLLEIRDPTQRTQLLIHNLNINIASQLASFSPTEHLVNSLLVDIPFYIANPMSVTAMQLVVTGMFKDTSQTTNALKAFTRVFALKQTSVDKQCEPVYEIYNDIFMLQAPTPDQIKKYHQELAALKRFSASDQQDRQANTSNHSAGSGGSQSTKSHEDMIKSIMVKTKMNRQGSTKLLQDLEWNEAESIVRFNELFRNNQIPQEFFAP